MRSWPSAPCGHERPRHWIRRPTQSGNWDYYLRLAEGAVVFAKACGLCLEGVIWKRAGSFYRSGKSHRWLECLSNCTWLHCQHRPQDSDAGRPHDGDPDRTNGKALHAFT
jgi:hypothetical protein